MQRSLFRSSIPGLATTAFTIRMIAAAIGTVGIVMFTSSACSSSDTGATTVEPTADAGDDASAEGDGGAEAKYMPEGFTQMEFLSEEPKHTFKKADQVLESDKAYVAVLETDVGSMTIDLYSDDAPITVNSFVFLSLHHYFDGIAFHRVIDGFMAQAGDPNSLTDDRKYWGTGGPGYEFELEAVPSLNFVGPGVVAMAHRNKEPDSNGSQFFITFGDTKNLNQQYTIWGKVTEGLDVLPEIERGEPPTKPTRIVEVRIGSKTK